MVQLGRGNVKVGRHDGIVAPMWLHGAMNAQAFEACPDGAYGFPGDPKSGANATSSSRERTDSLRNKLAI